MSKALNRLTSLIAVATLVVAVTACSDGEPTAPDPTPATMSTQPAESPEPSDTPAPPDPSAPAAPSEASSSEQSFDGAGMTTETITANNMDILVPAGFRIPEDTLVTEATMASVMMADEDPAAVVAMINASAAEAGYEVYAEVPGGTVFVGQGNAVVFTSAPRAQLLTWGPEAMKDLLAGN